MTGRKLGPISDSAGDTHRAWLEPLRRSFLASGLTVADLADQSRYSKSKISELLRGEELYPRWEIIHSVLRILQIPAWPMCRLWMAAALEANKKQEWITERFQRCLSRVRTALAIDVMRFGLMRDLRKICQDFSRAIPRSTGARDVASARLTVRCVGESSPPGGRLRPVVTQGPAPV